MLIPMTEENEEDVLCHPQYNTTTLFNWCSANTAPAILLQESRRGSGSSRSFYCHAKQAPASAMAPLQGAGGTLATRKATSSECLHCPRQVSPGCFTWHRENHLWSFPDPT